MTYERVTVVGGGLAGCECACQLADRDIPVVLHEMRPCVSSPAHRTDGLAELVCSNSLKSTRIDSAAGLLKEELRRMGSVLLSCAERASVPAGGALAVDRDLFSALVAQEIDSRPLIHVVRGEVTEIPEGPCVIAAGPLCSPALSDRVLNLVGGDALSFFDAAAPIVDASTIDRSIVFSQSRYDDQADGDYLNAPFTKDEYNTFIDELVRAERVVLKDFERRDLFQACQPAEEVARTGHDAIRYGAMKPVGLTDPRTGRRPWAAVQLRAENAACTAYNLVGFQTNLTFGEQKRVFRMIPGLENAEFFRYGVMHRNTFVDAPHVLDVTLCGPWNSGASCWSDNRYGRVHRGDCVRSSRRFEYVCRHGGAAVRLFAAHRCLWLAGGICHQSGDCRLSTMHVNFGVVPPLEDGKRRSKRDRYAAYSARALSDLEAFLVSRGDLFSARG